MLFKQITHVCTAIALLVVTSAAMASDPSRRLVGVVAGKRPVAIFMLATEQGGTREVILEAGDVLGSCVIDTILSEEALLECQGESVTEFLKAGDAGDVLPVAAQWRTILLDATSLKSWLQNRQQLLTDVDFRPVVEDGYIVAYQIDGINPGSEAEKLSLEPGDIIQAYNNIPIKNIEEVIRALKAANGETNYFTLSVFRAGEVRQLTYLVD